MIKQLEDICNFSLFSDHEMFGSLKKIKFEI